MDNSIKTEKAVPTIIERHVVDGSGNACGGRSTGEGFGITWQDGPLLHKHAPNPLLAALTGKCEDKACVAPNGAQPQDIIDALLGRLRFVQKTHQANQRNSDAIAALEAARESLMVGPKTVIPVGVVDRTYIQEAGEKRGD